MGWATEYLKTSGMLWNATKGTAKAVGKGALAFGRQPAHKALGQAAIGGAALGAAGLAGAGYLGYKGLQALDKQPAPVRPPG
jgi:uncharacterized membrane protein YebE (DUF533 family)